MITKSIKYYYCLFILIIANATDVIGLSLLNVKTDTFIPTQQKMDYIYNKAIDILIKNGSVFEEKPKFTLGKDTIKIINHLISNIRKDYFHLYWPFKDTLNLVEINCQNYIENFKGISSSPIINIDLSQITSLKNRDLCIFLSHIYKNNKNLYINGKVIYHSGKYMEENSSMFAFKLEWCEKGKVYFRNLFTNINAIGEAPCVKLIKNDTYNKIHLDTKPIKPNKHWKDVYLSNKEYPVLFFLEYNIKDKKCK